jgi:UDP-3-O-[3-hydroxymyristoyl] glucosamine N-acyltransferase
MPDFVRPNCELTTGEIAALTRAKLRDGDPPDRRIGNIAPLDTAQAFDISFLDSSKYIDALADTGAGALLVAPRFVAAAPRGIVVLETPHPYGARLHYSAPAVAPLPHKFIPQHASRLVSPSIRWR